MQPTARRLVALELLIVVCAAPAGAETLGFGFPRKPVVLSAEIGALPVVVAADRAGRRALLRINGEPLIELETLGDATRLEVELAPGENLLELLVPGEEGEPRVVDRVVVTVVPPDDALAFLADDQESPAAEAATDGGEAAVDLLPFFGGLLLDDEPPYIFTLLEQLACLTDVDVHRPISQDPAEPLVAEGRDFGHGASTLRNDDRDAAVGAAVQPDALPVPSVATDLSLSPNAEENDLVRVDAYNLLGLPRTMLFVFPLPAEASRDPAARVAAASGRQAAASEIAPWIDAVKTAAAPGFPRAIPVGATTLWLEGLLGGRYRLVVGVVPPNVDPTLVTYVPGRQTTNPPLQCMRQATVTATVGDRFLAPMHA